MTLPFVTVRRYPYEEPYLVHLEFFASNGVFGGATDLYADPETIGHIGMGLQRFPARVPDQFVYEYGSDDPADRFYRHLGIRAYTVDTALQFSIDRNATEPHEGVCRFSIPADAAALNRLGDLLVRFAELRHLELRWTPALAGGELFEN